MSFVRTITRLAAGLRILGRYQASIPWATEDYMCVADPGCLKDDELEALEDLGWEPQETSEDGDHYIFCTDLPPEEDVALLGKTKVTNGIDGVREEL